MAVGTDSQRDDRTPLLSAITGVLIALLVFTPLIRAGLTPLAGLITQLLALVLTALLLWSPSRLPLRPIEWLVIGLLAVMPLLYLMPLPAALVDALPGRAPYAEAMALLDDVEPVTQWKTLTLVPFSTIAAGLALIVPLAVFIAARSLDPKRAELMIKILLAVAAVQALFGLLQFGVAQGGLQEAWGIKAGVGNSATGTYPNRNHLAGLMELTAPIAMALFFYHLGRSDDGARRRTWGRKAAFWASKSGHATMIYGVLMLLLILAAVFTRSRSGIFLMIVGLIVSTAIFSRRIGGSNVYGAAGTLISLAVAGAAALGLAPVLNRFSMTNVEDDLRWTMFEQTFQGAGTYFPFGSGPGTFPNAFPALQPVDLGRFFVNRAHNDYLQWLFDVGVVSLIVLVAIGALVVIQWLRIRRLPDWPRSRFLQTGAGIGILLLAVHELVDYNLYTPANQVAFALLAGIFFTSPQSMASADHTHRRRHRRTQRLETETPPEPLLRSTIPVRPPPEQIPNPFLDP